MAIETYAHVPYITHTESGTDFEREPGTGRVVIEVPGGDSWESTRCITITPADWAIIIDRIGA